MKRSIAVVLMLVVAGLVGVIIGRAWQPATQPATQPGNQSAGHEREILYWKAPMDPNYRRDEPGKSPMGMDLVPVYADETVPDAPGVVSINPVVVNNLGVRTARVAEGSLPRRIKSVGYVGYDEATLYQVSTRVEGWIEKLAVKASGEPVNKGQVLFELYSPDLVNAQHEHLAALRSGNTMMISASRERLAALGLPDSETRRLEKQRSVRRTTRVYAAGDGVVAQLGIREGGYVTPATQIMTIAALDPVWVLVEVMERQAGWVRPGLPAQVEFESLPGELFSGVVDYVYPELDLRTRTLKVRLRLDNPDQLLRPNMFAKVEILGGDSDSVVHVPREALIRGGAVDRVVIALGDGRFQSMPVQPGIESGDRVAILEGLSSGDMVVTSGQFLIDSESNIDTASKRMAGNDTRASVAAVVEGWRTAQRRITLRHDPIEAWSWPSMSMGFDVSDATLLQNLHLGQQVQVVIKKQADDTYVVTDIDTDLAP
ncbi:MAG: efflux RND transporter periplasmic adaptor subunit [Gammaproteobacteria bacterium]|nr:efflux RND transporter periplasmic adaptor subunit [Gammaproteobacteria bacterium]